MAERITTAKVEAFLAAWALAQIDLRRVVVTDFSGTPRTGLVEVAAWRASAGMLRAADLAADLLDARHDRDEALARVARLEAVIAEAEEWVDHIAHDERVTGWVHAQDYSLYCLLADCPVNFAALDKEVDDGR